MIWNWFGRFRELRIVKLLSMRRKLRLELCRAAKPGGRAEP